MFACSHTYSLNVSLENIIYGWNIDKTNCAFVNVLLILASFSVYKARIQYSDFFFCVYVVDFQLRNKPIKWYIQKYKNVVLGNKNK